MRELLGRLGRTDPDATASLKAVDYFDALVRAEVGIDGLLRAAAAFAGCTVGYDVRGTDNGKRISATGERLTDGAGSRWPTRTKVGGSTVWLERAGDAHPDDLMIIERLAMSIALTTARTRQIPAASHAIETVIDPDSPIETRRAAAWRLRLPISTPVRVVAAWPTSGVGATTSSPTAVIPSSVGPVQVAIAISSEAGLAPPPAGIRRGLGLAGPTGHLPRSLRSALIALRLASDARPQVDAESLGVLIRIAEVIDADAEPPADVTVLDQLDVDSLATLDAVATENGLRAAARALGLHHSTVQTRVAALSEELGYDVRSAEGRIRYGVARMLHRLR